MSSKRNKGSDAPHIAQECPLTAEQQKACRLRTLGAKQWNELAEIMGKDVRTLTRWAQDPAWAEYEAALKADMHDTVMKAHQAVALHGGLARLRAIRRLEEEMASTDSARDVAAIAGALDRLTTSAEDRGGYPKSERREHSGEIGVKRIEDMTDEELLAMAGD